MSDTLWRVAGKIVTCGACGYAEQVLPSPNGDFLTPWKCPSCEEVRAPDVDMSLRGESFKTVSHRCNLCGKATRQRVPPNFPLSRILDCPSCHGSKCSPLLTAYYRLEPIP